MNTERLAKVIRFKEVAKKCSFCGRELFEGKDRYLENEENGKIICFKPCVIEAQRLLKKDEDEARLLLEKEKEKNAPNENQ